MSKTLDLPEELYEQLETKAHESGFGSISELLASTLGAHRAATDRHAVVNGIDQLRERLKQKYGEMTDSVSLIRDDRSR